VPFVINAREVGGQQNLTDAPCDHLGLKVGQTRYGRLTWLFGKGTKRRCVQDGYKGWAFRMSEWLVRVEVQKLVLPTLI
jgi:hypothetical protein